MSELFDTLKTINTSKVNQYRNSEEKELWKKTYNSFMINKMLSFSQDAIEEVSDIAMYSEYITPEMSYEYFLYKLPKKNRYIKYERSTKDELIDSMCLLFKINKTRAMSIEKLLLDDQKEEINSMIKDIT